MTSIGNHGKGDACIIACASFYSQGFESNKKWRVEICFNSQGDTFREKSKLVALLRQYKGCICVVIQEYERAWSCLLSTLDQPTKRC